MRTLWTRSQSKLISCLDAITARLMSAVALTALVNRACIVSLNIVTATLFERRPRFVSYLTEIHLLFSHHIVASEHVCDCPFCGRRSPFFRICALFAFEQVQ